MPLRVWEEEKAAPDPDIAMKIGKIAEIFEEQTCGNILPVGAPTGWNSQEEAERRARKNQAGIGGQKEVGTYNRMKKIERKRNEATYSRLEEIGRKRAQ